MEAGQTERAALEKLYLSDGWYCDGPGRRVDHYTGLAFHTYALLLHRFAPATDKGDHLVRARLFAPQFANWFDGAGRSLAFGRSMTYRFATVAFFGAYALADDDPVLDWGILKGIVLRNLRWWSTQWVPQLTSQVNTGTTELICFCRAGDTTDEYLFDQEAALRLLVSRTAEDRPLQAIGAMTGTPNI